MPKKYESTLVDININNVGLINQNVNLVKKSRIKAFRKSLLFPGSGQLYAENKTKGFSNDDFSFGSRVSLYIQITQNIKIHHPLRMKIIEHTSNQLVQLILAGLMRFIKPALMMLMMLREF